MALPSELALTPAELDALLADEWNMRIATTSPSGRINLTPLWFVWHDGKVWAWCRGQKVTNLRRQPQCTVLVDRNTAFPELQGVMFQADVEVLEDAEAEAAHPALDEVRRIYGRKYDGGHGAPPAGADAPPMAATAKGRSWRWIVVTPTHTVTWDNTKISRG